MTPTHAPPATQRLRTKVTRGTATCCRRGAHPGDEPTHKDLYWDATALPAGQELADAAVRLLARLSDAAVAARWDTWDGDQARRPEPATDPDRAADKAAALALIRAAHQLLCAAVGIPAREGRCPRWPTGSISTLSR